MNISLLPIGAIEDDLLVRVRMELSALGSVDILQKVEVPAGAYDRLRNQYRASPFLDVVKEKSSETVLGITHVDLFSGDLNFVFGIAEMRGRAAVISTNRLRDEDAERYYLRTVKEAFHELGHVMGLPHCYDRRCVMAFSNSLADTDYKGKDYCPICRKRLKVAGRI